MGVPASTVQDTCEAAKQQQNSLLRLFSLRLLWFTGRRSKTSVRAHTTWIFLLKCHHIWLLIRAIEFKILLSDKKRDGWVLLSKCKCQNWLKDYIKSLHASRTEAFACIHKMYSVNHKTPLFPSSQQRCLFSLKASCRASCLHLCRDISLTSETPENPWTQKPVSSSALSRWGRGGSGLSLERHILACLGEGIRTFPWDYGKVECLNKEAVQDVLAGFWNVRLRGREPSGGILDYVRGVSDYSVRIS